MKMICPRCMRQFDEGVDTCPDDGARLREFRDSSSQIMGLVLDGRYRIEEKIGEGGMGEVYRARQLNVDRVVAVKVLRLALASSEQYVARFFREADIATSIQHPHFVSIYDFGQTENQLLYIAMELLDGQSLATTLKQRRISLIDALTIGAQTSSALAAAHEARIVHRDLKPDNIFLIDVASHELFVKVLDFGIAKDLDSADRVTRTGQLFGTPEYMSPEQCEGSGRVDGRSDLYALGCILYEVLSGRSPFQRDSIIQTLLAQASDSARTFGELGIPVPSGVEAIVMRLLEKHPDNRYGSAIEVRDALNQEIDRLRANSGELQVYETVSAAIRPRDRTAQTVSYSDLGHPLQLEGVLASSARSAIQREAEKRRESDSERSTENLDTGDAPPRRMPLLAIVGFVAILGVYAAFRDDGATPAATAAPPTVVDLGRALQATASAREAAVVAAREGNAQSEARRRASAVALAAATVVLAPRTVETKPAKPPDPRKLDGGTGVRTLTSMNARLLREQHALLDCYNRRSDPADAGDVTFVFAIEPDGVPKSVAVSSKTLKSKEALACMEGVAKKLEFYPATTGARFEKSLTFSSKK